MLKAAVEVEAVLVPSVLLLELLRLLMEATLLFKALPGQPKVWV